MHGCAAPLGMPLSWAYSKLAAPGDGVQHKFTVHGMQHKLTMRSWVQARAGSHDGVGPEGRGKRAHKGKVLP